MAPERLTRHPGSFMHAFGRYLKKRIYILIQKFYLNDTQENDFEIVGAYANFTKAKEELEKIKKR